MAPDTLAALAVPRPCGRVEIIDGWFRTPEADEAVLLLAAEADGAPVGFLLAVACGARAVIADFELSTPDPALGDRLLAEARLRLAARGVFHVRVALTEPK